MKNYFFIAFLLLWAESFAQSDYRISFRLRVWGIENELDLKKYRFGFINGNADHHAMSFDLKTSMFDFAGNSPHRDFFAYVVIEKDGEFMVIRISDPTWLKKVRTKFKPGYFKIDGNKLYSDTAPKPELEMTETLDVSIVPKR